jgi:hypothetical protein
MPTQDSHNNNTLHGSWHLLVEMRARIREINSTVIHEYFIVVSLIFCCLLFMVTSDCFMLSLCYIARVTDGVLK